MKEQRVLCCKNGYKFAGEIIATIVDFPGYYAIFLVRDICTHKEHVVNSKDLVYI